jgi:group II intron reverse transcriptase/maturase
MVWTTVAHHIDLDLLKEAYRLTRKSGAAGVDGQTAEEYAGNLEENLQSLLERFKSGRYKAPPVRRVYIPKADRTKTRPIGIPTFEDKILQRAVTMVLEAIYEQDFLDCSYGFRPGRSAHQALEDLRNGLWKMGGGFILEVDIQAFFDSLDHSHLRSFLDKRVRDGVIRCTINKWLKAGVLEEGSVQYPEGGTPQGGVISPLLANIFLHEVMDRWFEDEVKPRLSGPCLLIRYADDLVLAFSKEGDARRVMAVLPKRFGKFGLALHPEKTRLMDFRRPREGGQDKKSAQDARLGTFDLLGFTHYWGKSRVKGKWIVKRKTARKRFTQALKRMVQWCRTNRHLPVREQHRNLVLKLRGHYQYYGITGNGLALSRFYREVRRAWRKWLDRRSTRGNMDWDRFALLLAKYPLPQPRPIHSALLRAASP